LIGEHELTVRQLESVLARYLKKPDQLPPNRPTCRPSKQDPSYATYPRDYKPDAIEYLTQRIKSLELEIKEVRLSVDRRSTMPYGFASYSDINEAHNIAYACRKKHPNGSRIRLAPRPHDIIWRNMPLDASTRRVKRWINLLWVTLLTILWVGPNAMIAIFLVNLSNLGKVWPAFQTSLEQNTGFWGAIQGILSPALMSTFYLLLPIIFRRLSIKAGDQTKTGRERHVVGKLYNFFVINNLLIFTFFSTMWGYVAGFVQQIKKGGDPWSVVDKDQVPQGLFLALCTISPFWVTWLLQRQLGAAIDLAQLWPLVYGFFMKRFSSPTPRELIELTAPPAFEYASYYNYFLYYGTVALVFAGIQPLVLPAAALYFVIDVWLKKYLILYVFVTKTESGGVYWRVLFNRLVFAAVFSNCVVFLTVWVRGWGTHEQAYAVIPLPFLMLAFKFYCRWAFDNRIQYVSTTNAAKHPEAGISKESRLRSERLASRFGHPALYKPLITPMVHQKAQNVLHTVYSGRLSDGHDAGAFPDMGSVSGYSDAYALDRMKSNKPGQTDRSSIPGFEFVAESQLDFENFKHRAEFASEHGGAAMYGGLDRPGTPSTVFDSEAGSRPGTPVGGAYGRKMLSNNDSTPDLYGSPYQGAAARRMASPTVGLLSSGAMGSDTPIARGRSPLYAQPNDSSAGLVRGAAPLAESRDASMEILRTTPSPMPLAPSALGYVDARRPSGSGVRSAGYAGVPQEEDVASSGGGGNGGYDYFRAPRARGGNAPGSPRPGQPYNG
jgi:hypothetical protein